MKSFCLTVLLWIAIINISVAQVKNEKEDRIHFSHLPIAAQDLITKLPEKTKRLKFYKETDGTKLSYEAKFKYQSKRYSLEFSEKGSVEDIEVLTGFKRLNEVTKNQLNQFFNNTYKKHKLIKIQKQYVYSSNDKVSEFLNQVLKNTNVTNENLEIIAEVTSKTGREIAEFTFSPSGKLIKKRLLKPSSYEHVLY